MATSVPDGAGEGVGVALADGGGGARRGVQGGRVVGAGRRAGPGGQAGGQTARTPQERALPAAAHRYSSSRMRDAPPGAEGRDHAGQQPEHPGERQPAAGVVELVRRSARSAPTAARRRLVSNAAKVALPVSAPVAGGELDRTLPVAAVVEGADLLVRPWRSRTTAAGRGRRMPGLPRARRSPCVTAADDACQAFSNAAPEPRAMRVRLSFDLASKPAIRACAVDRVAA